MRPLTIRERILLAVLAPATLVALLVTGTLAFNEMVQDRIDQHRRLAAVARQLAAVAEYNLFIDNREALNRLLQAGLREPDIIAAAFLDAKEQVLASTEPVNQLPIPAQTIDGFEPPEGSAGGEHWHRLAIHAANLNEIDLYTASAEPKQELLGYLLMKVVMQSLRDAFVNAAAKSAAVSGAVLFAGMILAYLLSRKLIGQLSRISRVVGQVGNGIGGARVERSGPDELGQLASGIDRMIERVEMNQARLAAKVAEATLALRKEKEEAEAAAQSRSRFFAAASHDLRQPAQALGLFVDRLERDAVHSPLQPQLHKLGLSVNNLRGLLDALLDYSRLDGQAVRVESRPVAARQAIPQVVDNFSAAAAAKGLALRARIADCWLMTDPTLLHRILLNLVSNAVRYTHQGGVLVTCRQQGHHAQIAVWDTGPGIPPEFQETIFDELVQLDNPERDPQKGLGLGLAVVRRSADLLQHPLALHSRVGRGSCFSLRVPLAAPPQDQAREESGDTGLPLLLIGPATAEQDKLLAQLEDWQFRVSRVSDRDAAWSWIVEHGPPRVLIFDAPAGNSELKQAMGWLDRIETATTFVLPALLISSGPVPISAEIQSGAVRHVLSRPFRPARLRAVLRTLHG